MSEARPAFASIWPGRAPLIGMVHLLPLPGAPRWGGSMDEVQARALRDASALAGAGFDAVLVENFLDAPFHREEVPPETVAGMARVVTRVVEELGVPVGVNVLRNDARAALAVATASGARFVRVNVHTGAMWTDQGLVEGRAERTLRDRARLGVDVAILADVFVKHATPPQGARVEDAARDAWDRGLADALVVTGAATGARTDVGRLRAVRAAVPEAPVLVGSGVGAADVASVLEEASGVIVGSAIAVGGRAGAGVDPLLASAFVRAARG